MNSAQQMPQNNPLASPQRETAGANTFEKFEYQYHWALCRILGEHEHSNDYVVFIELHEDVVLASSSDVASAKFEFSQIKNVSSTPWTSKKLTSKPKANSKKEKNSILGKMLQGVRGKPFLDRLNSIDLVATCGFNLKQKKDGFKLSVITMGDLHDECIDDIQAAIEGELGAFPLPKTLRFVTPDLPSSGFQDATIGRISKLVDLKSPDVKCNASTIYRVLIDDLHRKGSVTFDFTQWENLVKNKGVTHSDVDRIISAHTQNKGIELYRQDFEDISNELGLKFNKKIELRHAFDRYFNAVRLDRTLIALDNHHAAKEVVEKNFAVFNDKGAAALIQAAMASLPENVKKNLVDDASAQAAIIYELLSKCYEK